MFNKKLTAKILLFLVFSDLLETFSQFCFKRSAMPAGELIITDIPSAIAFFKIVLFSPFLWFAFISVFITFAIWSTILSKIDLSVAVPVASFSYILVPLASIVFLHEQVTALDWTGIIFILIGVIFVSLSSEKKDALLK